MDIVHFSEINEKIFKGTESFISDCDIRYEQSCKGIADQIAGRRTECPIILLSGPSGSGKTTTALKIEAYLDAMGIETHTVSMDNYFLPREEIQIFDENNEIDYESPYRIDMRLLQDHMMKLANYESVEIPGFDFKKQQRVKGKPLQRKKGEMILFEGIHALNPEVTGYEDISNRVYVSVRTRVQLSNGELVHPELIRLMRRIIRDRNFRSRRPAETLDMFDSVQRGENLYINPYKCRAHFELDTFHEYEASVYKKFLETDLGELKESYSRYLRFSPMENLLKDIEPISTEQVSNGSMIREFIGGSSYKY